MTSPYFAIEGVKRLPILHRDEGAGPVGDRGKTREPHWVASRGSQTGLFSLERPGDQDFAQLNTFYPSPQLLPSERDVQCVLSAGFEHIARTCQFERAPAKAAHKLANAISSLTGAKLNLQIIPLLGPVAQDNSARRVTGRKVFELHIYIASAAEKLPVVDQDAHREFLPMRGKSLVSALVRDLVLADRPVSQNRSPPNGGQTRSEEHTSELQSLRHLVC